MIDKSFEIHGVNSFRSVMATWIAIALLCSVAAFAQQTKPAQAKAKESSAKPVPEKKAAGPREIDQLAWFVGKWHAEIKPQNGNPGIMVDSDMRWAENRRAILFQVYFTSKGKREPHYFGMYAWDPGDKVLKMWQVASDGNLSIGRAKMEGNLFSQDNHMVRADGTTQEQHAEIVRDGNDAFNWKVQIQKDGQFVDAVKLRYERVKGTTKTSGGMQ